MHSGAGVTLDAGGRPRSGRPEDTTPPRHLPDTMLKVLPQLGSRAAGVLDPVASGHDPSGRTRDGEPLARKIPSGSDEASMRTDCDRNLLSPCELSEHAGWNVRENVGRIPPSTHRCPSGGIRQTRRIQNPFPFPGSGGSSPPSGTISVSGANTPPNEPITNSVLSPPVP